MANPKMQIVFWSVAALDTVLLLVVLASALGHTGSDNVGREMELFFFVIFPAILLGLMVLLYIFSSSALWRWVALIIVAGPGLFLAAAQVRNAYIDYAVNQNRIGRGYFSGSALKAMGAAVVQADLPALQKNAPGVDLNTAGENGMTLIALAVEKAYEQEQGKAAQTQASVVQTLLQLGAKPDPGIDGALKLNNPAILRALLDAGGNPNLIVPYGQAVVFSWIDVMPLENLRLLADHGLDLNTMFYDAPLPLEAALHRRWDLLAFLIERGADIQKPRKDGRTVRGEITGKISDDLKEGRTPDPRLLALQSRLKL